MKRCKIERERERERERARERERPRERSLDSLKIFKRYTDICKKQLCLIFFNFPF